MFTRFKQRTAGTTPLFPGGASATKELPSSDAPPDGSGSDMHPDAQKFFAMSPAQKRLVHLYLADAALKRWRQFVDSTTLPISYVETVVGTYQKVDIALPGDALRAAAGKDPGNVAKRYQEPMAALQDDDWRLPDDIEYAYYAINNTFRKYALNESVDDWLIVNQALASLGLEAARSNLRAATRELEK